MNQYKKELIEVAKRHKLNLSDFDNHPKIVICEPCMPYIPDPWNGILVLAEAQNLSETNHEYVDYLQSIKEIERILRLYKSVKTDLSQYAEGVKPWDDNYPQLALLSINQNITLSEIAVGNAVPWSAVKKNRNLNPTDEMKEKAIDFWIDMFKAWRKIQDFNCIITLGKVAQDIMEKADVGDKCFPLRLPSPHLSLASCLFEKNDLLERYPEVCRATVQLQLNEKSTQNMIFFACHAVSRSKNNDFFNR